MRAPFALAALAALALLGACTGPRTPPQRRSPEPLRSYRQDPLFGDEEYLYTRVSFEAGQRRYLDPDFGSLEDQVALGFTATHEPPDWVLGLDGGMFWSGASGDLAAVNDIRVNGWEGFMGVMKTLPLLPDRVHLELGLGYALSYLYIKEDSGSVVVFDGEDLWWSSGYARASLQLRLGGSTWIGLTARGTRGGSGELVGVDLDADYEQLAFTLTAGW